MSSKYDEELSYATHRKHTVKFKIVFIGDQSVGKSSIINRFIKNEFDTTHNPTVGIDFVSKNVIINDKSIRLQLWDTAGQQRFKSLIPGYLRDSHAIFLVYDVTNRQSYNNIMGWMDYVKQHRGDEVIIFIIGNKIDIPEERALTTEQAYEGLKSIGAHIIEVSAKTGQNLQTLFKQACTELLKGPGLETTFTEFNYQKQKKESIVITGEKQRPIKKQGNIQSSNFQKGSAANQQMRGSKLIKKKGGKIVRQKNCC